MTVARKFENDQIYHIFNRGIEKREIFLSSDDYRRFFLNLNYFIDSKGNDQISKLSPKEQNNILGLAIDNPKVELLVYCIMPNHFHLILKQTSEGGITKFVGDTSNSYSKYFNTKYNRVGPLFQGRFKAVVVSDNEHLIHLSRYIHLNPFVADIVPDPFKYIWSSLNNYITNNKCRSCNPELILGVFLNKPNIYQEFVSDYADYAKHLDNIKKIGFD